MIASAGSETTSYGLVHPADVQAEQIVDIGGVVLALGPSSPLDAPEPRDRWLVVGDGSVSSVTDRAWALRGVEVGTIRGATAPDVAIAVEQDGMPITRARSGPDGSFALTVPPGSYTVRAESLDLESATRALGPDAAATVTAGGDTIVNPVAGGSGTITVGVVDDAATPLPARIVATADGFRRIDWTDATGEVTFSVPPGTYTVTASRGMEYDAFTATGVVVADGGAERLDAVLSRVLDTDGWISLDTHLHSEMSSDSKFPLDRRLLGVAGEGVEVAISTDHDFVTDYAPVIEEIGLSGWLTSRVGEEISSIVWGHINAWPLPGDRDRAAAGAVHWYRVTPGDVMARAYAEGATIVQINHPRQNSMSGLFEAIDLDPASLAPLVDPAALGLPPDADLADWNFDAIEVGNSLSTEGFEDTLVDWLAFVAGGHPAAATGSSDSHGASAYAGDSRTYVYVGPGNDDPATVDLDAVDAALRARRAMVAQGMFVVAGLELPGGGGEVSLPGDLVDLSTETEARIHIRVQAPPWLPTARIRIYADFDQVISTINLDPGDTAAVRYDQTIAIPLGGADAFFVVRVDPAGPGAPVIGTPTGSITNPLFVDADGDGAWTPLR
jgi:hypothetical protein